MSAAPRVPIGGGSYAALVTPMLPGGEVDLVAYEKLLRWHVAEGTNGLVVLGTTGEAATLTASERTTVVRLAVKVA